MKWIYTQVISWIIALVILYFICTCFPPEIGSILGLMFGLIFICFQEWLGDL